MLPRTRTRKCTLFGAALAAGVATMALAPSAVAGVVGGATFTVNDTGDAGDANGSMGDGTCDTVAGGVETCTLRAAISEANAAVNPGADTINFDQAVFTGTDGSSTIVATGTGPSITEVVTIDGGDCDPAAGFKPCAEFEANSSLGLTVAAANVTIRGLAITSGGNGGLLIMNSASNALVAGNWFGLNLDQTADANSQGLRLEGNTTAGDNHTIGGETPADRNVFAHNLDDGLRVNGSDDITIKGNYFGTKPDGTTPAPNGTVIGSDNIEVSSVGGIMNPASNITIGGTQSAAQLMTPECDGPCNVIANSGGQGVDLETEGGSDGSSVSTTFIKGNFIGLDRTGETAAPNAFRGIQAGLSSTTNSPVTVGGAAAGDRNVIAGNTQGGLLVQGNATVQNNYFGSNSEGDAAIPNLGTVVGDVTVGGAGDPSTVEDNRFAGNGVSGGRLFIKDETTMTGNVFGIGTGGEVLASAGTAITVGGNPLEGDLNEIGGPNPGDGNTIGNVAGAAPALLINGGDDNQVRGNLIGVTANGAAAPNSGPGIQITNSFNETALNNQVGGTTLAEENVISNSGTDAIEIFDNDASAGPINNSGNAVLRNRGANNGMGANDLFIDLRTEDQGNGPGNPADGPNAAIDAPMLTEPTTTQMTGTGVTAYTVRVYKTFAETNDDVRGFADDATVDGGGTWTAMFALPNGQCLSATQTDAMGNTSELRQPSLSIGDGPCDVTGPTITINSPGPGATTGAQPALTFSSPDAADTYECRLDGAPFVPCTDMNGPAGSHTTAPLADGPHTFEVRGTDEIGNLGPVATRSFTVNTTPPPTVLTPPTAITPPATAPAPPRKKCKKGRKLKKGKCIKKKKKRR